MTQTRIFPIISISLILITITALAVAEDCDDLGVLIYEDLGCTVENPTNSSSCPSKFSCLGLGKWTDKCYFKGKPYEDGKRVEDDLLRPSCNVGCFCNAGGNSRQFTCAILDCPEHLGRRPGPGCYSKYTLGRCCASGEICEPLAEDLAKCKVGGNEFKEGQRFYPENSCLECVCQKGFKGELKEPFCRRQSCGIQLRQSSRENLNDFCGPIYGTKEEKKCCPHSWVCPNGSEQFQGEVKSEETCKYGEKTLKVGQTFERENVTTSYGTNIPKVKCECLIPPLLTCIKI